MLAVPDPSTFAVLPWRPDDDASRACSPTSTRPRARPTRATRATCCAARSTAARPGLRPLRGRGGAGVLPLPRPPLHRAARRGRLLRPHDARRRLGRAARDRPRARAARHRRRALPPRGRPEPARGRPGPGRGAEDGRRRDDLPHHGQGVRHEVRVARDLHAQADLRPERLGDAHAPGAGQGRRQRLLRRRRHLPALRRGQGVHRRPAAPRPGAQRDLRPVGELLQAPRARLRGAGLRRLEPAQPLRARPRPAAARPGRTRRGWSCAARTPPATRT